LTIVEQGLTIVDGFSQAHAGDLPKGQKCVDGDTNSMAAFLIGAGPYSYYHCSFANAHGGSIWGSAPHWCALFDWRNQGEDNGIDHNKN
jgi:hypothetical protein